MMKRLKNFTPEELEQGRVLNAEFLSGVPFVRLAKARHMTKDLCRELMLAAWRADKNNSGAIPASTSATEARRAAEIANAAAQRIMSEFFDGATLREMVQSEVRKFPPQTGKLEISLGKHIKPVTINQSHAQLKEMLATVAAGFDNIMLVGPAGSGKTTLGKQLAQALKRPFGMISLSGGTTEGALLGRNQLDAAFLSRFAGAVIEVGYDEGLERSLVTEEWYVAFTTVRGAAMAARLRRVLGTRELIAGQRWLNAGRSFPEVWQKLTTGWTPDERIKARVTV